MENFPGHLKQTWRRTFSLGWPIAIEQTLNTLMRTVDIIVSGFLSPTAVAAIGLADLYSQLPLRIGLSLGTGAITLASQDTGRGAENTRDQAITQALLIGVLCGLPIVITGFLFSRPLIRILGADASVVQLGGLYLAIILFVAPMRIIGLVGSRSLQGTGDTRTPMLVNGGANLINILLTASLGLGLWIAPEMGIVGIGVATAVSRTFVAVVIIGAIASTRTAPSLVRPREFTIVRQLILVSIPNFAEGLSSAIAYFPLNALLVLFGTEVTAGYHIARRVYQQLTGPLYRSFSTVSSIIVGQLLGEGHPIGARKSGHAILLLSILTLCSAGVILFVGATKLVSVFTGNATTIHYAAKFTQTYGVSMLFIGIFYPLSGALRGAGDTRTPFYARFIGTFVFMVGLSYLLSIVLNYGLPGVYLGIILSYVCWAGIVVVGYFWSDWAGLAATLIEERDELNHD